MIEKVYIIMEYTGDKVYINHIFADKDNAERKFRDLNLRLLFKSKNKSTRYYLHEKTLEYQYNNIQYADVAQSVSA